MTVLVISGEWLSEICLTSVLYVSTKHDRYISCRKSIYVNSVLNCLCRYFLVHSIEFVSTQVVVSLVTYQMILESEPLSDNPLFKYFVKCVLSSNLFCMLDLSQFV